MIQVPRGGVWFPRIDDCATAGLLYTLAAAARVRVVARRAVES